MPKYRHRVPLGLVLLAQGWITHPQLQAALEAQRAAGEGRIGYWLVETCGLEESFVARGLGLQWSCPVLSLEGFEPSAMALTMPKRLLAESDSIPVRIAGSRILYLAAEDTKDAAAALSLERMTGLQVESGLLPAKQYEAARQALSAADEVHVTEVRVADGDDLVRRIVEALEEKQPVAARFARFGSYFWLRQWLESGSMSEAGVFPTSREDVEDRLFTL